MSNRNVTRSTVRSTTTRTNVTTNVDTRILNGIVRVVGRRVTPWVGSMTELNVALTRALRSTVTDWPENPRGLRSAVDRIVPQLRRLGIKTRFGRTSDHARKRFVQFQQ